MNEFKLDTNLNKNETFEAASIFMRIYVYHRWYLVADVTLLVGIESKNSSSYLIIVSFHLKKKTLTLLSVHLYLLCLNFIAWYI